MNQLFNINGKTFELLKLLGKGSYGSVYLIELNNKKRAIKIATDQTDGVKYLREIDIMSRLSHPNLTALEGLIISTTPPTLGLIMPVADDNLYELMKDKSVSVTKRLKVIFDILSGIEFLHSSNYLHLDIKPLNVLIFKTQKEIMAKVTDFNLSLYMNPTTKNVIYPSELVTLTHRPIENLKGSKVYSTKTDVWSLAMTMLEVLSGGKTLFTTYTENAVIKTIESLLNRSTIDTTLNIYFQKVPKTIKPKLINLLKKMFDFNPQNRPEMKEIISDPLFSKFKFESKGYSKQLKTKKPISCNILYYYGSDFLIRTAIAYSFKLETFFLAADIYNKGLAYIQPLTGDANKDWGNVMLLVVTSLLMAVKITEIFTLDLKTLTTITYNAFPKTDIIRVEAALTQLLNGQIYNKNLFTESNDIDHLVKAVDLVRDCNIYYRINLDEWKSNQKSNQIFNQKYVKLDYFLKNEMPEYYKLLMGNDQSYLEIAFKNDFKNDLKNL